MAASGGPGRRGRCRAPPTRPPTRNRRMPDDTRSRVHGRFRFLSEPAQPHPLLAPRSDRLADLGRKPPPGYALAAFSAPGAPSRIPTPIDHLAPTAAVAEFCATVWPDFSPPLTRALPDDHDNLRGPAAHAGGLRSTARAYWSVCRIRGRRTAGRRWARSRIRRKGV